MEWWKNACVYQIYPKSFQDSNGDGIGDINGIRQRLPYLKELGAKIIWITPMYTSPQNDNGYDIADYYNIDPLFGTMADFDLMLEEAHQLGLKIVMDIVVNHTSTQHAWFQDVLEKKDKSLYFDYYIIKSSKTNEPPNNWESMFGGSAWEPMGDGQYYLHLFDKTQADLNWESDALRKEIYLMMHFWLKKGVDGFRLDVINLISKHQEFSNDVESTPKGKRFYANGPRMHEFLKEMNQKVFKHYQCVSVGEMMSMDPDKAIDYTLPNNHEVDMIFSFQHLKVDYKDGDRWTKAKPNIKEMITILDHWQSRVNDGGGWNSLVWSNHDQPRVVSRFGHEGKYHVVSAKMLATALHLLKGTPYIYQGEEIGMLNAGFDTIESYQDVETINIVKKRLEEGFEVSKIMEGVSYQSRDNGRTPMQWSNNLGSGFSNQKPWIPFGKRSDISVTAALADKDSIFYHYQKLIYLRENNEVLVYGNYKRYVTNHDLIWCYAREYNGETWYIVNYFGEETIICDIPIPLGLKIDKIILSNYEDSDKTIIQKKIRPFESIVYQLK